MESLKFEKIKNNEGYFRKFDIIYKLQTFNLQISDDIDWVYILMDTYNISITDLISGELVRLIYKIVQFS